MNICIVGAGLGGLSAALALLQKGFRVTVLEQASVLGEIGAGVQLGPNAVGVLYRLGLQTALEQVTCETLGKRVRLWNTGQTWPLFDLGTVAREMYGYPYLTVHRADLHRVLVDAVRALQADAIVLHAKLQGLQASSDPGTRRAIQAFRTQQALLERRSKEVFEDPYVPVDPNADFMEEEEEVDGDSEGSDIDIDIHMDKMALRSG